MTLRTLRPLALCAAGLLAAPVALAQAPGTFIDSFSTGSSANGDVVALGEGEILVSNYNSGRIDVYSESGIFLRIFAFGLSSGPLGFARTSEGNIAVLT